MTISWLGFERPDSRNEMCLEDTSASMLKSSWLSRLAVLQRFSSGPKVIAMLLMLTEALSSFDYLRGN